MESEACGGFSGDKEAGVGGFGLFGFTARVAEVEEGDSEGFCDKNAGKNPGEGFGKIAGSAVRKSGAKKNGEESDANHDFLAKNEAKR